MIDLTEIQRYDKPHKVYISSKAGMFVKEEDVIQLLNTSDNSDYAVQPTAASKLPSFNILKKHMQKEINEGLELDHLLSAYHTIKKLGNFA